jgi:hypothetical protein
VAWSTAEFPSIVTRDLPSDCETRVSYDEFDGDTYLVHETVRASKTVTRLAVRQSGDEMLIHVTTSAGASLRFDQPTVLDGSVVEGVKEISPGDHRMKARRQ